ncbi:MAG TPA: polymer-forming cytoskeletal protein [Polyangiaceae bacterium]|jgi:cytoskeletal protein CcmA (bactofilin family)
MVDSFDNSGKGKQTVVEEGSEFKGTLSSSCGIVVRGRIDGDIEAPSLAVSASGAVHGRVKVTQVVSEGEIAGEFEADSIQLAGSVRDSTVIRARSLEVKLSSESGKMQITFGECELSVGDEPVDERTAKRGKPRRNEMVSERPPGGDSTEV